ncbi:putative sulfate exporter family transporter [Halostagnicola sp. A56]|uniref:putative sulfate exporter family transporter n=1 Tax=Halostagnicola sp. A56 TaxID=1495067 RepID=UPI0009E5886B|nr:putative sulfate exporter family transporter [Halostagnicola sp. A56]
MGTDPIPTPSIEDLQDDPMADEALSIFRRRQLLRPQHVPQKDRIVGRDHEIETVETLLKPAAFGNPPESGFLFGKTGTGKSLVAKHVTGRARGIAQIQETELTAAYVDCDQYNTETRAARKMAFEVRDSIDPDRYIPKEGVGTSRYYDSLWGSDGLLHKSDSMIVILDEIDKLGDDTAEILSKLSRSEEAGKTGCYISVVAISNKTDYTDGPDERVASSFQDDPIIFPPYNATQLQAILERRKDAFKEGVLEEGVIELASALAARDHGDARRALDILRSAGKLAEKGNSNQVNEEHIVLMGVSLTLDQIIDRGVFVIISVISFSILTILSIELLSRLLFDFESKFATLLAAGASICGVSAVVAVAGSIKAKEEHIAYAAATVLLFDSITLIFYPIIGQILNLPAQVFGMWAGVSMFSTGPAVAAGFTHSDTAGQWATLTKLTRNSLIGLITVIYTIYYARKQMLTEGKSANRIQWRELWQRFPKFIIGFIALIFITSIGFLSPREIHSIENAYEWLFLLAFVGFVRRAAFLPRC